MSAGGGRRKKQKRSANGHEAEDASSLEPAVAETDAETDAEAEEGALAEAPEAAAFESAVTLEVVSPIESAEEDAVSDEPLESAEGEPASDATPVEQLDRQRQKAVVESLIFVSERTVTSAQLARAMKLRAVVVRELVAELMQDYRGRGIDLIEVAGGYQFRSAALCAPFVREFVAQKPVRLTRAQLETLALIAYRQPITRPEIDDVRGVDTGSAIRVLLERGLIKMLGRKDEPGRPLLYGTSSHFLEFFGMRSLRDLPTLREFTELNEENRALFKRKTGESVEQAEAELLAADEVARGGDEQLEHISDEDLAELAAEAETDMPPPPDVSAHDHAPAGLDSESEPASTREDNADDEDDDGDEDDDDDDLDTAEHDDGDETADPP